MVRRLGFDSILAALDRIMELSPNDLGKAARLLRRLDSDLERLLEAAKIDEGRRKGLVKGVTLVRSASASLFCSLGNARQKGQLSGDWLRFAQNDFLELKEDLMALREFLVENADFVRLACLRDQIGGLAGTNPEKLFEELHEAGVLSERTWVLLISYPGSWKELLRNEEISKQISQLSAWLLEFHEVRKRRTSEGGIDQC
ncbi:MAG: hypothetical protein H5T49_01140 [Hadesarchaea archaeon]|nr:hypothetical protein [Hadesarchaea archaeon]